MAYRERIVSVAKSMVGRPAIKYVAGHPELGQSPELGFDCSGFARFVLISSGLEIPDYIGQDGLRRETRHANELFDTYGIPIADDKRRPGDLVFFSRNGKFPTHIGIVLDSDTYVHSPGQDNARVEAADLEFKAISVENSEGIIYSRNPIGFKAPTMSVKSPTYRYHQRIIE